jgi:hypothetical protein
VDGAELGHDETAVQERCSFKLQKELKSSREKPGHSVILKSLHWKHVSTTFVII